MRRHMRVVGYPLSVEPSTPEQENEDARTCINCEHYADDKPTCRKYMMSVGSAIVGYKDGTEGPCGFDRRGWSDKNRFARMLRGI